MISLPEHGHVDVLNRGGLWKVNEDVVAIFIVAEAYFLSSTKKLQNKILSKHIVNALMENCMVLENFAKVRRSSPDNIKTDIAFNLLEDLLTLYFRVHTFSSIWSKNQQPTSIVFRKPKPSRLPLIPDTNISENTRALRYISKIQQIRRFC